MVVWDWIDLNMIETIQEKSRGKIIRCLYSVVIVVLRRHFRDESELNRDQSQLLMGAGQTLQHSQLSRIFLIWYQIGFILHLQKFYLCWPDLSNFFIVCVVNKRDSHEKERSACVCA